MESFASRLKEIMMKKQLKPSDLSRLSHINQGTITHYMHGKYEPRQDTLTKLATILNVDEAWLAGYDVPMQVVKKEENADRNSRELVADEFGFNKSNLISIIKTARLRKGFTQVQLSLVLGYHKDYIQHIELGHQIPSLMVLIEMSKLLDINLGDLESVKG